MSNYDKELAIADGDVGVIEAAGVVRNMSRKYSGGKE